MKNVYFLLLVALCSLSYAQTKEDILEEAKRRNITSADAAIKELNANGVSLSQAEQMARMRGLNVQDILSQLSQNQTVTVTDAASSTPVQVVSEAEDYVIVPEDEIQELVQVQDTLAVNDDYFGYEIFRNNPFGTKDYLVGNIDEGYILAPGDELKVTIYGDNSLDAIVKIDLNGNIVIPGLGVFQAAGNSFETFRSRLTVFLGKFYNGLVSNPVRTFMDVSLTQIRPVNVTIVGEVNTPGPHLVNGLATVMNALYASGGIKTSGSLRIVKVFRDGRLFKTLDLYDFITSGKLTNDIRLTSNDIIFIPPRLNAITLSGAVKRSGIYEILPSENLEDLITYSGGLPPTASLEDINISRILPFEKREQDEVFDRYLTTISVDSKSNDLSSVLLEDGDEINFRSILEKRRNRVTLTGNVNRPGEFSIETYPDLRSLIEEGGKSIADNTYLEKVDISRIDDEGNLIFKTYSLQSILDGSVKVSLLEDDTVKVYSEAEVEGSFEVSINGFVSEPKTISWRAGLNLFDFIFQTTSYEELEYQSKLLKSRIDLRRFNTTTGDYFLETYSFDDLQGLKSVELRPKDEITVYTRDVMEILNKEVQITGAVKNPGSYPLNEQMFVEDVIIKSGGFLEYADKNEVYLTKELRNLQNGSYSETIKYDLDLDYLKGLKSAPENSIVLDHNDIIRVILPLRAGFIPQVTFTGEVNYPGSISLENDRMTFKNALNTVGGLSSSANLASSYIIRGDRILYANLKKSLNYNNLFLQDGDNVIISSIFAPVETIGGVQNPSVFNWNSSKRSKYYIRKSGGKQTNGGQRIVVHLNGSSEKINFFRNPKINPGDKIVVQLKPEKSNGQRDGNFMDDLVRIFGLLTGSLTTILLANRL